MQNCKCAADFLVSAPQHTHFVPLISAPALRLSSWQLGVRECSPAAAKGNAMQPAASYPRVAVPARPADPRVVSALAGSLTLLVVSYLLLLSAPLVSRHLRTLPLLERWLPTACATGLALGGGAALLFVLVQVTREAERRPYVCLAPVLAAFAGCVLVGLGAQLPLPGVPSEHIAVFALAVAVVGGALVQQPGLTTQLSGLACTLLPSATLLGVIWMVSGKSEPAAALWALDGPARAYLVTLATSSLSIGVIAVFGRSAATPSSSHALVYGRGAARCHGPHPLGHDRGRPRGEL